jgi:Domain of unknown function (DUF4440)
MNPAATLLPDVERRRLRALAGADTVTAAPLHADDYQLITPNGSVMSKADYLGAIASGQLRYQHRPRRSPRATGSAPRTGWPGSTLP